MTHKGDQIVNKDNFYREREGPSKKEEENI